MTERAPSWCDYLSVRWRSRGIGLDDTPGCFVCGGDDGLRPNIAAHVAKVDEVAALRCFERGARMAYYHGDVNSPQIKVGACEDHRSALEHLSKQWFISFDRVSELAAMARRRTDRLTRSNKPVSATDPG